MGTDMHTWKSEVQMQKSAALIGMVSHQTDFTELAFSMFSSKTDICPKRVPADGCGSNPASVQMRCGSEHLKLHAHHTSKLHCFTMSPGEVLIWFMDYNDPCYGKDNNGFCNFYLNTDFKYQSAQQSQKPLVFGNL
ncbi:hypothetical protein cypCar_00008668 [Cyprinus carpio]|nr:hypothetical protein cypCar_00008668 [Cyprinus carpio]